MTPKEKSTFESKSMRPCGRSTPGFSMIYLLVLCAQVPPFYPASECCCLSPGRVSKHKQPQFVF